MAVTSEKANEVLERIESGELKPENVDLTPFIEDELAAMTPELAEKLPDEKIREYNDLRKQQGERELAKKHRELNEDHREALDSLESAIVDPQTPDAEAITIGDARVEVRRHLSGKLEQALFDAIESDSKTAYQKFIDVLVGTDEMDGLLVDAEDSAILERATWEAFYSEYGTEGIAEAVDQAASPALDRIEERESFRG